MRDISKWIMVLNCWRMVIWNISTVLPCGGKKDKQWCIICRDVVFFFLVIEAVLIFKVKSHLAAELVKFTVGSSKAVYEHEQLSEQPSAKTRVSNVITLSGAHQPTQRTKFVLNLSTTYERSVCFSVWYNKQLVAAYWDKISLSVSACLISRCFIHRTTLFVPAVPRGK